MDATLDSIRVHTELNARVTNLEEVHSAHVMTTEKRLAGMDDKLDALIKYKVQLRTIVAIGLGLIMLIGGTGLMGGGKWLLKQAAQEVLIENGIIQLRRAP